MLTTLALVKAELLANKSNIEATENSKIMKNIRTVEQRLFRLAGFGFAPYYETRTFNAYPENVSSVYNTYNLHQYLMAVNAISLGGTAYTWGTDIVGSPNFTPYHTLRITADPYSSCVTWYPTRRDIYSATNYISITGWWGYRRDYSTAWLSSGDTVQSNPLTISDTSLKVSDADGFDDWGRSPRFSPGNLIRFEDGSSGVYEVAEVTAVDYTTNIVTIRRGQRGTTATAHVQSTALTVWTPEPEIEHIVSRQAALLYSRRGAFTGSTTPEVNQTFLQDLLAELYDIVDAYSYSDEVQH